jgi:N-acetyl-beta-hexosaminidase
MVNDAARAVLKVVKAIFTEMAALFPDEVMHVGCDETTVVGLCTMNGTLSFEEEILKHVISLGKKPTAWEEALVTGAARVAPSMTLQLWVPSKATRVKWSDATQAGFNVLRSDFNLFYMDYDRRSTAQKTWFNITADQPATFEQTQRVHGGEAAMSRRRVENKTNITCAQHRRCHRRAAFPRRWRDAG